MKKECVIITSPHLRGYITSNINGLYGWMMTIRGKVVVKSGDKWTSNKDAAYYAVCDYVNEMGVLIHAMTKGSPLAFYGNKRR